MDMHGIDLTLALERLYGEIPAAATLRKLRGDASTRTYYRLTVPSARTGAPKSLIVMHLPADALKSDEGQSNARPAALPFTDVQKLLAARGVRVPGIFGEDLPRRFLLLQDLGDETFGQRLHAAAPSEWERLYRRAVETLAHMHEACSTPDPESIAFQRAFDEKLLRWELDHFREWGLEAVDRALSAADRTRLDGWFDELAREIARFEKGFVHRDYQSRNLMWVGEDLYVIDFQDAFVGPAIYDIVALLCDSYVVIPEALQESMLTHYIESRGRTADADQFRHQFWTVALQRKLKDAGRFVYIDRVRKNSTFLEWYGQSLAYVGRALRQRPDLVELETLLRRCIPGFPNAVPRPRKGT